MNDNNNVTIKEDKGKTEVALKSEKEPSAFMVQLEEAEIVADKIANSTILSVPFQTDVTVDGIVTKVVNKNDIIANILLGQEIGLNPMASIMLGRKLSAKTYLSVIKGRAMGLDLVSSMTQISVITTANGDIYHTSVHIITNCIIRGNASYSIIKDFEPIYKYSKFDTTTGKFLPLNDSDVIDENGNTRSNCLIIDVISVESINRAKEENKIIVQKKIKDRVTTINFKRPIKGLDFNISYSLQQATDAGLYRGYHSELLDASGNPIFIDGKDNWNKHAATMLRNRPLSIGGRVAVPDILHGIYETAEAAEIVDAKVIVDTNNNVTIDIEHEEVK